MTVLLLTVALFIHQGGETAAFNNITNTTTNTTTSTSNRRGMPSPWCYWLPFEPYEREVATYWEAESICRHNGLHLTSVHSAEENNFVLSLLWHGKAERRQVGWGYVWVLVVGRLVERKESGGLTVHQLHSSTGHVEGGWHQGVCICHQEDIGILDTVTNEDDICVRCPTQTTLRFDARPEEQEHSTTTTTTTTTPQTPPPPPPPPIHTTLTLSLIP
ncbi:hypothetical protein Pcinc_041157 [Petrolisthes cinctipes]|uniref:C-type lectin domain-containing protein n=1 Tax=Petrolisthes cinctipes TaxID=88211 RepID=A0AAE1EK35_PETCI|nr:hypothetical protein Pcinc_041157 [Petrolisthes cinctipes]